MVNSLPWDILQEIIVRLPLKSIVRFRCVNHFWNNELENHSKLLKARSRFGCEMGKFNLMFHIEYPVESMIRSGILWGIEVFGYCFGLVLLRHVNSFNECVLMLWNPTTDECKRIPNPPAGTKAEDRNYEEYGFVFSERIEDFKVVHLTEALQEGLCEVQIYDMYWHGMSDAVRRPIGGAAHWLAHVESSIQGQCIVRFEFETEEFDATLLPISTDLPPTLCALGGSLCFFICDLFEVITMWELKNNVVEKAWNKLFTIELTKTFGSVHDFIPLKSLRNGKIVVGLELNEADLHVVLYDPKHGTVETL
ncbi:hypothetical protein MKW98_029255 [Papaver atlanticum]|uniref:F-box domain-containing protein n=1 Tax=Papaver atlanticum TaxID=357466 RepID=A0AAD4SM79_9MAGN|nr:hypothetical protein MKW98_029255 [Papaver atlanticum]